MGKITSGNDRISLETTLDELLDFPIVTHFRYEDGTQVNSWSIRDALRWVGWRMLWVHGQKYLGGQEHGFAYGDIDVEKDGKIKVTFFKKMFIPKEPGGP